MPYKSLRMSDSKKHADFLTRTHYQYFLPSSFLFVPFFSLTLYNFFISFSSVHENGRTNLTKDLCPTIHVQSHSIKVLLQQWKLCAWNTKRAVDLMDHKLLSVTADFLSTIPTEIVGL